MCPDLAWVSVVSVHPRVCLCRVVCRVASSRSAAWAEWRRARRSLAIGLTLRLRKGQQSPQAHTSNAAPRTGQHTRTHGHAHQERRGGRGTPDGRGRGIGVGQPTSLQGQPFPIRSRHPPRRQSFVHGWCANADGRMVVCAESSRRSHARALRPPSPPRSSLLGPNLVRLCALVHDAPATSPPEEQKEGWTR